MTGGINLQAGEPLAKYFRKDVKIYLGYKEPIDSFIGWWEVGETGG